MRGKILKINVKIGEALVLTDRGQTITVEVGDDFSAVGAKDMYRDVQKRLKEFCEGELEQEKRTGTLLTLPLFPGDRVSYKKVEEGQYVMDKLLCPPEDPRAPFASARVEKASTEIVA
jgi:hypothetical protein